MRIDVCVSCGGETRISKVTCDACGVSVEGRLPSPALFGLPPDQLEFVTRFILCGGSLKALAGQLGVSYPTVRARLDRVMARLAELTDPGPSEAELLDKVAAGELSAAEAAKIIKQRKQETHR